MVGALRLGLRVPPAIELQPEDYDALEAELNARGYGLGERQRGGDIVVWGPAGKVLVRRAFRDEGAGI
jgi:hypothetical protein